MKDLDVTASKLINMYFVCCVYAIRWSDPYVTSDLFWKKKRGITLLLTVN